MDLLTIGLDVNDRNITEIYNAIQESIKISKEYKLLECKISFDDIVLVHLTVQYKSIIFILNLINYKDKLVWQLFPYQYSYMVFPSIEIKTFKYLFYCMNDYLLFLISKKTFKKKNIFINRGIHILRYCIYKMDIKTCSNIK